MIFTIGKDRFYERMMQQKPSFDRRLALSMKERDCISNDAEKITEALLAGHPVIAHMGPGIFTSSGHYIVLRGITEDGYVLVNDPGSKSRNKYAYLLSTIVEQARTSDSFMVCDN